MQAGQVLADRFRIGNLIGEGGIGRVYRADDLRTNQPVAIKSLRAEYAQEARIRRRFMREARAVKRLHHPHIVRMMLHDETPEGVPYIVMEFLDGDPLSQLRESALQIEELLLIVDQTLSALAYSHARGIIHRDVKPENIVVCRPEPDGPPLAKLLDFGFARVEGDTDPRLTQVHGDAFGTPQYMAPEQASGKGQIGPPTDVYAVGVILYEFIAGRPPFTGAHGMAVALKHLMEEVPPLVPRPGLEVPPGLTEVVMRALRKAPHERFLTAPDMRRALVALLDDLEDESQDTLVMDAASHIARVVGEIGLGSVNRTPGAPEPTPHALAATLREDASVDEPEQGPPVGRDADLVWLWERVRAVCENGVGRMVLLGGAPGLGKSHLVGWLRDQVAEGAWMLTIGGVHGPTGGAGGGLRGALDELFGHLPEERSSAESQVREIVLRWSGAEGSMDPVGVSALVSYLRPDEPGSAMHTSAGTGAKGEVLYARICDALRLAAQDRPILLTLEGVHRAGSETRGFVEHLARYLVDRPFPVLAVITFGTDREGATEPLLGATLAAARKIGPNRVERYQLTPLSDDAIGTLLDAAHPLEGSIRDALVRRAEGNPFFARELLLYLRQAEELVERGDRLVLAPGAKPDRWPADLPSTLLLRAHATVRGVDDADFVESVLERAVVLGEGFDYGLLVDYLQRTTGAEPIRVERAIEALLAGRLLEEARDVTVDRLSFVHRLLRDALHDEVQRRSDMASLHRAAAEAMVHWFSPTTAPVAADIARHLQDGGQAEAAATYFMEAAGFARDEGNIAEAFAQLEAGDALLAKVGGEGAEQQRATLWLDLGEMELHRAGFARAQSLAVRVHGWARKRGRAFLEGRALLLLSDLFRRQGSLPEAARGYAQAGAAFQRADDARGVARCLLGKAMVERGQGRQEQAERLFEQARAAMEHVGDVLGMARASRGLGEIALRRGDFGAARGALEAARGLFEEAGDRAGLTFCEWLLGETQRHLLQPDLAMIHFEAARRGYASQGDRAGLARCHVSLGRLHVDRGDWNRGGRHLQSAVEVYRALGDDARAARVQEELGLMALRQGSFEVAGACLADAIEAARAREDRTREVVLGASLAWVAAERGDARACHDTLRAALEIDRHLRVMDADLARALEGIGEVDAYLGNTRRAGALMNRALEIQQGLGDLNEANRLQRKLADLR